VYATPGQTAGKIITPSGGFRGVPIPVGAHVWRKAKKSLGCPLFDRTASGERAKEDFYRRFNANLGSGGTSVIIIDLFGR